MPTSFKQKQAQKRWRDRNRDSSHRRFGWKNKRDGLLLVVYVIEAFPYIKIGIAADIHTRLINVKCNCPLPVSVAYCSTPMLRPLARAIEISCHRNFIATHIRGEWFKADAKTAVDFISSMTVQQRLHDHPQLRLVGFHS